jgi:hypothetical protein
VRADGIKQVYVDSDVYRKYIELGGNATAASFAGGEENYLTAEQLLECTADFARKHGEQSNLRSLKRQQDSANVVRATIRNAFIRSLESLTDDEKTKNVSYDTYHRKLEDMLSWLTWDQLNDNAQLYPFIIKLVCDIRFADTSAGALLLEADRIMANSPNISVQEAMAISTYTYLIKWMASEFVMKKAGN